MCSFLFRKSIIGDTSAANCNDVDDDAVVAVVVIVEVGDVIEPLGRTNDASLERVSIAINIIFCGMEGEK